MVVVGILIALQVNTWNEERKLANEVLALFENIPETIDSSSTARNLLVLGFIEDHNPSFSTYNEIQGSGKLALINSKKIKNRA